MYPYNYNIPQNKQNIHKGQYQNYINPNDERFIPGGFIAPLLLGGVAGYAIGNNNRPNYYPYPIGYAYTYPANYYSNNYYYRPYGY